MGRINTINDMTEDAFILILRHFSLQKCIGLRRVCHWWKAVIERSIMAPKRSLKYFSSDKDAVEYLDAIIRFNAHRKKNFELRDVGQCDDDLVCKTNTILYKLPKLFPSLTRLTIRHYDETHHWQLSIGSLLMQWPQLEELVIFGLNCTQEGVQKKFWPVLNDMPKLKELHLFDMGAFNRGTDCNTYWRIPLDAWVLERVTKFSLVDYGGHIGGVLQLLGSKLKELLLDNVHITTEHFAICLQANPRLPLTVTHLTIGDINGANYERLYRLIATQFVNLTHLDVLGYREIRLDQLLDLIAGLSRLEELSLNVCTGPKENLKYLEKAPTLPNVEWLYIKDVVELKADVFLQHFPRIFPRIIYLQFETMDDKQAKTLLEENIFNYFKRLKRFEPISPKMGSLKQSPGQGGVTRKQYTSEFAGKYHEKMMDHFYEANPYLKPIFPEGGGEPTYLHYSEGEDSDEEMFREFGN